MEQYYVISNMDGETRVEELSKDELLNRVNEKDYGDIGFMNEIKNIDTNYWGDNLLIIKGSIVKPIPKDKIIEYDID